MPIDAVIFDCDGTLVDSETLAHQVLVDMVRDEGLQLTLEEAMARFAGIKMAHCIEQIEQRLGRKLPEAFVPTLRTRTVATFEQSLRAVDGAAAMLERLRVPYCVASSGPRAKIELSLRIAGLLPYFAERIFSAYEVGCWKPDPGLFLHAAKALGVEPARCAVVEDSAAGIEAGVAAGMTVFAFGARGLEAREGIFPLERLLDLPDLIAAK